MTEIIPRNDVKTAGSRLGYIMDFDPHPWDLVSRKTRNTLRKADKELYMGRATLDQFKAIHWDPTYLPKKLKTNQVIYAAYQEDAEDDPISAIIIEEYEDHLVYKYAANVPRHRNKQGNSYLLWYIVEAYRDRKNYLDLGGSAKPGIDRFKRQFATRYYIINKKPLLTRLIAKIEYHIKKWMDSI